MKYNMNALFAQLGMPNSDKEIAEFFSTHQLRDNVLLPEAGCWNAAQREFLTESLAEDSVWSGVVDEFDTRIRKGK